MKENIETALLDIARVIKRERKRRRYLVGTRVQMGEDVAGVSVDVCERALGCMCVCGRCRCCCRSCRCYDEWEKMLHTTPERRSGACWGCGHSLLHLSGRLTEHLRSSRFRHFTHDCMRGRRGWRITSPYLCFSCLPPLPPSSRPCSCSSW